MKVLKKLTGVAVFFVALGVALTVTKFYDSLISLTGRAAPEVTASIPAPNNLSDTLPGSQSVPHKAQFISLDFEKQQSFTTLIIEREPNDPAPQSIWVWTYFFAPDDSSQRIWASAPVEIHEPFAGGDYATITATAPCEWCADRRAPRSGYYARVHVSTRSSEAARFANEQTSRDIASAVPVLVQRAARAGSLRERAALNVSLTGCSKLRW